MDPVYGYQAINVEAQERSPFSLLNWMKRMIALRKQHRTFARGTMEFLHPQNRKALAYLRKFENETILCVANLGRTVQPIELDLSAYNGLTPIEMLGRTEFPRIGELPYFLTISPYSFYWFVLERAPSSITARVPQQPAEPVEEVPLFLSGAAWETLLDGNVRTLIEREALVPFLKRQRWFAGKARAIRSARIADWAVLTRGGEPTFLTFVEVLYGDGSRDHYFVPMAARSAHAEMVTHSFPAEVVARIGGARKGVIYDAAIDDAAGEAFLAAIAGSTEIRTRFGAVRSVPAPAFQPIRGDAPASSLKLSRGSAEQSNTSLVYGNRLIMKLFRRIEPGPNPDYEIGRFLSERAAFPRVPPVGGGLEYHLPGVEPTTLSMLQALIGNQGNGWDRAIDELGRYFERAAGRTELPVVDETPGSLLQLANAPVPHAVADMIGGFLENASKLGRRTAELHLALASDATDPAFRPEPMTSAEFNALAKDMDAHAESVLKLLEGAIANLPQGSAAKTQAILQSGDRLRQRLREVGALQNGTTRIRIHGDYHLGQVLWAENDFVILDFEGEPARALAERRAKQVALKDVAGMLRSYSYAAYAALFAHTIDRPADFDRLEPWARLWEAWNSAVFLQGYLAIARRASFVPGTSAALEILLRAFLIDKALYELRYELNSRPGWLDVPLWGILPLIA
jgi:maltose alpha-D-glucosyltransferase/alpha-amylase